jgi:aspartate aminotransferase
VSQPPPNIHVTLLTRQRDENGKPYVLESVLKAEDILHQQRSDKEYLPITVRSPPSHTSQTAENRPMLIIKGSGEFTKLASELAYGKDSKPLAEGKVRLLPTYGGVS